jgi:hypothetical protein
MFRAQTLQTLLTSTNKQTRQSRLYLLLPIIPVALKVDLTHNILPWKNTRMKAISPTRILKRNGTCVVAK